MNTKLKRLIIVAETIKNTLKKGIFGMKKKMFVIGLILLIGFTAHVTVKAEVDEKQPEQTVEQIAAILEEANGYYDKRAEAGMIKQAVAAYKKILEQDAGHYEAVWRLARSLFWMANHEDDNQKALEYLTQAETITRKITEIYPKGCDGQYWYAVSMGRAAERRGIFNSLFAIGPMHETMMKIIEIDTEHGGAYHLLGVLYRKAPGWPLSLGDINKSLKYAEMALKYKPESTLVVLDYGKTLEAMGKKEEARKQYEKVQTMPGKPDRQPETAEDKEKAKAILAKMR